MTAIRGFVVVIFAVGRAAAQVAPPTSQPAASAPSSPSKTDARRGFRVDELTVDLGFDAEWHRRQTNSDARASTRSRYRQRDEARRFEETLGLRGAGDIGGDRFVRYDFDLRGGLSQERFDESRPGQDIASRADGDIFEYDARATIFPAGKITANVFASQLDDRVPRPFLPSLDRRRERYGAELLYNDRVLPMRLSFESEYEELSSVAGELNDDERRGEKRLEYEATFQPTEYHQLRLQYEYDDRSERYSGTRTEFDTVRNYVTLNHLLQFGHEHRSRLDTVARFQDETGDLARDVAEFAPQLRLQHTDSLASTFRAQYLEESFEGVDLTLFRGDVGLSHNYENWLDTGINLYGLTEDSRAEDLAGPGWWNGSLARQDSDTTEWGGVLTTSVNRENRHGRFTAAATYTHATERGDARNDDSVAIGESATFRDPLPIFLSNQDVRRNTIVVTDAARRQTYFAGRDFTVVQAGRYTSLVRHRGGRILDGQTVLVSYRYRSADGFDLNRDRFDARVQQAFTNGWTPYYAASIQREDIDRTRYAAYTPRDVNRHRAGIDYRRPRWSVGGELEYNDDSIDPYQAAHLRGEATVVETAPHSLVTRGTYSFFHFRGADELDAHDVSLADIGLNYRYLLGPRWELNADAAYRFEDDTLFGVTHGVDVSAAVNWRIGLFTASFEVEYDLLDLPGSDDGTLAAWIKLRREIPVIGRRTP